MSTNYAPERPLEPINYEPVITEYSWWTSKTGLRKFVIVRVHFSFTIDKPPHNTEVVFLELDKTEPVTKSWDAFVNLVEAGEMVKLT